MLRAIYQVDKTPYNREQMNKYQQLDNKKVARTINGGNK